jgi:hypothetical protein
MGDSGDSKPASIDEYRVWLGERGAINVNHDARTEYGIWSDALRNAFDPFWTALSNDLPNIDYEYLKRERDRLLMGGAIRAPKVIVKDFEGFLGKTWRRNCIENEEWPHPPADTGWLIPYWATFHDGAGVAEPQTDWLQCISDIVRTRFVTKYLDGAIFLEERVYEVAKRLGVATEDVGPVRQSTFAGHYGIHFETIHDIAIGGKKRKMRVEIQLITQFTEAISNTLHAFYRSLREKEPREREGWQWEYESPEFAGNYLGHILHYLDGQVVHARRAAKEMK